MNYTLHDDGTMTVLVDGEPQRRPYSLSLPVSTSRHDLRSIEPDVNDNEVLMRYVSGDMEIITKEAPRPASRDVL